MGMNIAACTLPIETTFTSSNSIVCRSTASTRLFAIYLGEGVEVRNGTVDENAYSGFR